MGIADPGWVGPGSVDPRPSKPRKPATELGINHRVLDVLIPVEAFRSMLSDGEWVEVPISPYHTQATENDKCQGILVIASPDRMAEVRERIQAALKGGGEG